MAADRTAPGPGGEARSLHRHGAGQPCGRTTRRGRAAFLLIYPDTYEIGLPNQGLQILYEILNERPDAVAERAYAPWTDMEASMRASGLPLFSVDTHRAAADFDVLAFNLSAELVYTNLLNLVDLAGRAGPQRGPRARRPDRDRGRALRLQPRAARRVRRRLRDRRRRGGRSARSPRSSARGSAAAARPARPCCASSRRSPASTCPSMYDVEYDGPVIARGHARGSPTCPRSSTSAPSPTSPTGRTRRTSSCRSSRSCTTGSTSRSSAAAPAGCRFCQAGHDHPARCASGPRSRCARWCATACAAPATTRSRSRRCRAPTSPGSTASSPIS